MPQAMIQRPHRAYRFTPTSIGWFLFKCMTAAHSFGSQIETQSLNNMTDCLVAYHCVQMMSSHFSVFVR